MIKVDKNQKLLSIKVKNFLNNVIFIIIFIFNTYNLILKVFYLIIILTYYSKN